MATRAIKLNVPSWCRLVELFITQHCLYVDMQLSHRLFGEGKLFGSPTGWYNGGCDDVEFTCVGSSTSTACAGGTGGTDHGMGTGSSIR